MRTRKLTATHVCEVTGYSRDQFRALLKELPELSASPGARMAREYSPHDLIVLNIVHTLDNVVGIRRKSIAALFPLLQRALLGPKIIAASARLVITFSPLRVEYVDKGEYPDGKAVISEGVIVPLRAIFDRVDQYLGVGVARTTGLQAALQLGPGLVRAPRRRGSTRCVTSRLPA